MRPDTLDAAIEQLRSVALEADDASGHFPAMYARVTDRVRRAATDGRFSDAEAMEVFTCAFAGMYLDPRAGNAPSPRCWQASWDVSGDRGLLIVQHLLLGINAHVNHDLPLTVVAVADQRGDLGGLRTDFDAINALLAETMPEVLLDLGRVSRWVNLAAARGGGRAFNFSLGVARRQAWRAAERLHPLDGPARQVAARELDDVVSVLAFMVTRPERPMRWLVPVARRLETSDPRRVTRQLLGHLA